MIIIMAIIKLIILLLLSFIALTFGATFMETFQIRPGRPRYCFAGQHVLYEGQKYGDSIHCRYYICSKGRMPDELILYINTCGAIEPPENCDLIRPPRGTPYPKCCERKLSCKN